MLYQKERKISLYNELAFCLLISPTCICLPFHGNKFSFCFILCRNFSFLHYAPNFEKVGDILVSACPCVCVCVCVSVCLCVCVCVASKYRLETSCMDSSWKNSRRIVLVFPELSPLVKLQPFDKQRDEIL